MTESLKKKYDEFVQNADGEFDIFSQKELFVQILKEEAALFSKTFGGGHLVRLLIVSAMCEKMAETMCASLDRRDPGAREHIDFLKTMMGVMSFEPQGRK